MKLYGVNLAITNNPKGGLFRGVAVSTACVMIRRKPATQAQSRQKSSFGVDVLSPKRNANKG